MYVGVKTLTQGTHSRTPLTNTHTMHPFRHALSAWHPKPAKLAPIHKHTPAQRAQCRHAAGRITSEFHPNLVSLATRACTKSWVPPHPSGDYPTSTRAQHRRHPHSLLLRHQPPCPSTTTAFRRRSAAPHALLEFQTVTRPVYRAPCCWQHITHHQWGGGGLEDRRAGGRD